MTTESARQLVEIAETGGARDLDQIYREHAATVSRWVRRLSDAADVSDTLQEVFEVAHRRLASFRGDSKLTTWLYSITIHVVSARRRRAKLRKLLFLRAVDQTDIWSEPVETPFETLSQKQACRVVYQILDRMSERDRTLLILFEIERLAITDIAAVLELSSNSVSVGLHRARARFRKLLARHFPDEAQGADDAQSDA